MVPSSKIRRRASALETLEDQVESELELTHVARPVTQVLLDVLCEVRQFCERKVFKGLAS